MPKFAPHKNNLLYSISLKWHIESSWYVYNIHCVKHYPVIVSFNLFVQIELYFCLLFVFIFLMPLIAVIMLLQLLINFDKSFNIFFSDLVFMYLLSKLTCTKCKRSIVISQASNDKVIWNLYILAIKWHFCSLVNLNYTVLQQIS